MIRTCPDRPWGPPSLLYKRYRVFPWGQAAGARRWPFTPSSAEVKERVELYLYSTSGPSWPVLGRTFIMKSFVLWDCIVVAYYTDITGMTYNKKMLLSCLQEDVLHPDVRVNLFMSILPWGSDLVEFRFWMYCAIQLKFKYSYLDISSQVVLIRFQTLPNFVNFNEFYWLCSIIFDCSEVLAFSNETNANLRCCLVW